MTFRFWFSENRGLIRQRQAPGLSWHPEVWKGQRWVTGSSYVMDAITGMGEDGWSCGESAEHWDLSRAEHYAAEHGIDLYADNVDDPHLTSGASG
jgi:hypothetical protein